MDLATYRVVDRCSMIARKEDETEGHRQDAKDGMASAFPSQDVLNMIVRLLDSADLPAVRLASQELAVAVDNHTITALTIHRWSTRPVSAGSRRLKNVHKINLHTMPDWDHLQKLASQLPVLHSLSIPEKVNSRIPPLCAAALTSLTRLDLGTSSMQVPSIPLPKCGTAQLPTLRAASFNSRHSKAGLAGNGTLEDIAAFAPNLQQMYCQYLEFHANSGSSTQAVLAHCSHYGGQEVHIINASSKASGAAAFERAFPRLRVFSCLPHTIKIAAEQKHHGKWPVTPTELLSLCKAVHSVRGFGAPTARCFQNASGSDKRTRQLQQLRALSLRCGMSSSCTLIGLGRLRGLTHLDLGLNAPLSRHGPSSTFRPAFLRDMSAILRQLQHLPHLHTLALPAALLCSSCCNEGSGAAAAYSQLQCRIQRLAGRRQADQGVLAEGDDNDNEGNDVNNDIGSSTAQKLRLLVFVEVQCASEYCNCYSEACWQQPEQHQQQIKTRFYQLEQQECTDRMWGTRLQDAGQDNAVNNTVDIGEQPQQESHQKAATCLQLHLSLVCSGGLCLDNSNAQGLWGVYGPAEW